MCGLVGVLGNAGRDMVKMFSVMLQVDVIRGWDSTGVAAIGRKKVHVLKEVGTPQFLMSGQDWTNLVEGTHVMNSHVCLLGHNRAATQGKVTDENAHPFKHGHITLAHNGSLNTVHSINVPDKPRTFETDSESIAWSLFHKGIDWTWPRVHGAAALTWWDNRAKTLNLITNGKRPLFFAYDEKKKRLLYASKPWMILAGFQEALEKMEGKIHEVPVDTLHTFKVGPNQQIELVTQKLATYVPIGPANRTHENKPAPWIYGSVGRPWPGTHEQRKARRTAGNVVDLTDRQGKAADTKMLHQPAESHSCLDPNHNIIFSRDKTVSEQEFHTIYKRCMFCNDHLTHDYAESVILDDEHAACSSCATVAELEGINIHGAKGV